MKTLNNLLSVLLIFGFLFMATDADAQKRKKKNKKKKDKVEQVKQDTRKVMQTEKSKVCDVFTVENPDEAAISQMFADMNMRRQAGDYGPGDYSAYDYWQKVYAIAPGFDIRVYTDGSAIYRELAAEAKEAGDDAKFEEYGKKSLELLDKGEKCYPQHAGNFDPSRAYIYELLYPEQHDKILELYTKNLNEKTDAYSLGSIVRYAMYMGYIETLPYEETKALVAKAKAIATSHKGDANYDYAAEQIGLIEEQYGEWIDQMENPVVEEVVVEETTAPEEEVAEVDPVAQAEYEAQLKATDAYNNMISAVEASNYAQASNSLNTYLANEKDAGRKYAAAIYLASNLYSANDFPAAREAFNKAAQADPSKGEPYYYIGMMYLSSGALCGPGTGFDSQRVIWPAFDKLDMAVSKGLPADLQADVQSTKAEYSPFLPTAQQLKEQGLKNGATYTVPCWINESTIIRQKQ